MSSERLPPPYVDECLVEPETREEMLHARHGELHANLNALIGTHTAPGYVASTHLLTRTGPDSDFTVDTCIRRSGIDPRTGSRYLQEVAFEVVDEESTEDLNERAEELTACGVRRLIAVFVNKRDVCEWSSNDGRWVLLDPDGALDDPTLVCPMPLRALFEQSDAHDAMISALEAKNNPRLAEIRSEARTRGLEDGLKEAVDSAYDLLEIPIGPRELAEKSGLDAAGLASLLARIKAERWERRYAADEVKLNKMAHAANRARGMAEGKAEAEAEAIREGMAELLLKQLGLRFGPLPEATRARVESATTEQLDSWVEPLLTAKSIDEVFAP